MKKRYLLLLIPIFILILFIVLNNKDKNVSIKEASYDSAYTKIAVKILKNKANYESITNYEDGNKGEMYAFHHENTYQVPENTDYRYIGDNPNNYVYFNCSDLSDTSTCEIWRIVGLFPYNDYLNNIQYKIKLVRGNVLPDAMPWNTESGPNGYNEWKYATLKDFLNNEYYYKTGNAESYGLNESARNMISSFMYYLGGPTYTSLSQPSLYGTAEEIYAWERGKKTYNNRSINLTSQVGLLYSSDSAFTYAYGLDDNCYNSLVGECDNNILKKNWIVNSNTKENENNLLSTWLILSSNSSDEQTSLLLTSNGYTTGYDVFFDVYVRPVVYLNDNVLILSGNGTKDNPYFIMSQNDYMNQNFEYKIGDEVYYNNELYHVVDYSTYDSDYIAVMKDVPLTQKYMPQDDINEIGFLPFDYNDSCYYKSSVHNKTTGCTNEFNKSYIKSFLDTWSNNEFDNSELVDVDGNKVRLITKDEIINGLKFEKRIDISDEYFIVTDDTPDFIKNRDYSCWTMDNYEDWDRITIFNQNIKSSSPYEYYCVDPVLNLKKLAIGNIEEYHIGDEINYKDNSYYVISDSPNNIDYVTVLRKEPLNEQEISKYSNKVSNLNRIGRTFYKKKSSSNNSYENSDIKKTIDSWIDLYFDEEDLVSVNGIKGRLISTDELQEKFYYEYRTTVESSINIYRELKKTNETPDWIYKYSYWVEASGDENSPLKYIATNYGGVYSYFIDSLSAVRPIVYLKKSAIGKISSKYNDDEIEKNENNTKVSEKTCTPKYRKETITNYKTYNVGDEINYKDEKYYVIRNSDETKNYVTILKDEVFDNKGFNSDLEESIYYNITKNFSPSDYSSGIKYYSNDTCYDYDNIIDCKNLYDNSNIKKIIENWSKVEIGEDNLVSINNYKVRLLNIDELVANFGYERNNNDSNN